MGRFRVDRVCRRAVPVTGGGEVVAARCHVADRPFARLVGLLATPDLAPGEALWLERCGSVHTAGMRFAIACAFLDREGRVLRVVDPLPPWRAARCRGAVAVLEIRAGALAGVRAGDRLVRGEDSAGG